MSLPTACDRVLRKDSIFDMRFSFSAAAILSICSLLLSTAKNPRVPEDKGPLDSISTVRPNTPAAHILTTTRQNSANRLTLDNGTVSPRSPPSSQWSVGYYLPWAQDGSPLLPVTAIQWRGLTHIILSSALVNADGTVDSSGIARFIHPVVTAAHAHHVKALLSLEAVSPTYFNAAIENHLNALVRNIAAAVSASEFDGLDVDWEPAAAFNASRSNAADMTTLAKALRTALGSKIMTVFAGSTQASYYVTVANLFDRLQLATYAQSCNWRGFGWYNSALYIGAASKSDCSYSTLDQAAKAYIDAGVPAGKISLGLGFYGLKYTGGILASDSMRGISSPIQIWQSGRSPTVTELAYDAIVPMIAASNYHWDSTAMVPYINHRGTTSSGDWYITYDNPESITDKVQYCVNRNLGGWFIWWIGGDWLPGGSHPHPLLDAVTAGGAPAAVTPSRLPSGVVGRTYYASLSATGARPISWTIVGGSLPKGVSIDPSGYITGRPLVLGTYTFTLRVSNFTGARSEQFSVLIAPAGK